MKQLTATFIIFSLVLSFTLSAQTESYNASYVSESNLPEIDGVIETIWEGVTMVPIEKVPENNNITVPNPDPSDFSASFGLMWSDYGLFVIFEVTDDNIVIEDDYYLDNEIAADMWWTDDNINLLFSQDLINESFTQFEFAWQPGVDQEEKLSSDDWANPAVIDQSMVESAWFNEGDIWVLETFISWEAFGYDAFDFSADDIIYCEARVRDDDDDDTWESMFQWSTDNYDVESTGEGMGQITLTSNEITSISEPKVNTTSLQVIPNMSDGETSIMLHSTSAGNAKYEIVNITGQSAAKGILQNIRQGSQTIPLNLKNLSSGTYLIKIDINGLRALNKFIIP